VDRSSVDIDTAMRFLRQPRPAASVRGGAQWHWALLALKTRLTTLFRRGKEHHSDIERGKKRAA